MIEFKNVTKVYDGWSTAVSDLNLQINTGEFVFIVGPSESGKSTLFRLLTCMDAPTSGSIMVDDWDLCNMKRKKIPYYRRKLGIIFQDFRLFPKKTVFENVALALHIVGEHSTGIRMKSAAAMKMVELYEASKKRPDQLSPFDQQRVALARALAGGPGIIVADEPTGNLDPAQGKDFIELLMRIHKRYQKTVLVFTNNKEFAEEFGQRIIFLSHGVVEEDRAAVMLPDETEDEEIKVYGGDDSAMSAHDTGADESTQVFTAISADADMQTATEHTTEFTAVDPAVSEHTTKFTAVELAVTEHTTEFAAVDPAVSEQTTEFTAVEPAVSEHTTEFAVVEPTVSEHTTEFTAVEPAVSEHTTEFAAVDPAVSEHTTEFAVVEPAVTEHTTEFAAVDVNLATDESEEADEAEEVASNDAETADHDCESSDEEVTMAPENDLSGPADEETATDAQESAEHTATVGVSRVTDFGLVSAVMKLLSKVGNGQEDKADGPSHHRPVEDMTVVDDWNRSEKEADAADVSSADFSAAEEAEEVEQ